MFEIVSRNHHCSRRVESAVCRLASDQKCLHLWFLAILGPHAAFMVAGGWQCILDTNRYFYCNL